MSKTFKQLLIYLLAFQIGVSPTLAYAQAGGSNNQNGGAGGIPDPGQSISAEDMQKLAQNMASLSDGERKNLKPLLDLADALDGKTLNEAKIPVIDYHLLGRQRIEYFRAGKIIDTVELAKSQITRRPEAYTKVNVLYDPKAKELIFEGTRGEVATDEKPRVIILEEESPRKITGEVVVRQVIGGVDLKVGSFDNDLLVFLDSKGRLNALNNQFVKTKVFRSGIPVFTNLWAPLNNVDLTDKNSFITFRNRISPGIDFSKLPNSAVLPRAENGDVILTAGDVIAGYEVNGKVEYLGLFNRTMIAEDIHRMSEWAFEVGVLSQANEELAEKLVGKITKGEDAKQAYEKYVLTMSPAERKALAAIDPEALTELKGTSAFVKGEAKGTRDQFTHTENLEWAANAAKTLQAQYPMPQLGESIEQVHQLPVPAERKDVKDLYGESRAKKLLEASAGFLGKWYTITALAAGYVALPFAYDHFETLQQVRAISWVYHNMYTDVMKDASYRLVNARSVAQLMLFIPGAMLTSASVGWLLKAAAKVTKGSNSLIAQRLRDMAAVWGDMGVWQRIITFSNRYYAVWVYPVLRIVFSHLLRQKGLFSGLSNGFINPLERVKPDSEVGKKLGLKSSEFVLWNNPLEASVSLAKYLEPLGIRISPKLYNVTDAKAQAVAQRKETIQMLLKEQKQRYRKLAWTYAALVVGETSGVDPATLTLVANEDGKSILDLELILKDPKLSKQWELVAQEIYQNFHEMDVLKSNLKGQIDPVELEKMIATARGIGQKILKSKSAAWVANVKMKFRRIGLSIAKGTAEYSMDAVTVLRNSIPNKEVFDMVKREFILDHAQVVAIPAMIGERADFGNPADLAADPKGNLDTNPRHEYDVAFNAYAHLALSGAANTLTYYVPSAERETAYDPIEYKLLEIQERAEPLLKSTYEFGRYLLPDKSDIGGVIMRNLYSRLKTIQTQIYVAVFLRGFAYGAPPAMVAHMFGFQFFSMVWWWGWIWFPMQLGAALTGNRVEEIRAEMMEKQLKLSRAMRGLEGERSSEVMVESYREILESYRKYSPEILQKVIKLNKNPDIANLDQFRSAQLEALNLKDKSKGSVAESADYFGLLIKLAYAQKANDVEMIGNISGQIQKIMADEVTPEEAKEIRKLSSEALLELAMQHPPRTSQPHPLVPWMATQTAVMVSTYLAISWSVVIMNPDLLMDPTLIPRWAAYWTAGYAFSYFVLRREPYNKIVGFVKSVGQKLGELKTNVLGKSAAEIAAEKAIADAKLEEARYAKQKAEIAEAVSVAVEAALAKRDAAKAPVSCELVFK